MLASSGKTSERNVTCINMRVASLHHSICWRQEDGTAVIASFTARYVALAADFIATFEAFLSAANIGGKIARQVVTARAFLDLPLQVAYKEQALEEKMYQSYLAHRLLDKLNDALKAGYGCPIIFLDMTRSNLIMRHIIGEPFANKLDHAIDLLNDNLVVALQKDPGLKAKLSPYLADLTAGLANRYPCPTKSSNMHVLFKNQNSLM